MTTRTFTALTIGLALVALVTLPPELFAVAACVAAVIAALYVAAVQSERALTEGTERIVAEAEVAHLHKTNMALANDNILMAAEMAGLSARVLELSDEVAFTPHWESAIRDHTQAAAERLTPVADVVPIQRKAGGGS